MFKGLRTKIESEQKNQSGGAAGCKTQHLSRTNDECTKSNFSIGDKLIKKALDNHSDLSINQISPISSVSETTKPNNQSSQILPTHIGGSEVKDETKNNAVSLEECVLRLSEQLKTVMKEKDESSDQNAQLYQLIEKLRRNLENEKETNSSLRLKLNELETKLNDDKDHPRGCNRVANISIKSFNHQDLPLINDSNETLNDVAALRNEIIELQAQVAKKNRLLKIKQQNLIDLKKTLNSEMLDHERTQEELVRLQKQFKELEAMMQSKCSDTHLARQNGSIPHELSDTRSPNRYLNQKLNDENYQDSGQSSNLQYGSGGCTGTGFEETISLPVIGNDAQSDHISYLSHSSAGVDEFEHNDPRRDNYNKDINHEYLKNVLFRYMTSTDSETIQHLVKAISVLMDFSADQSAAIRNATNSRMSWLRLK